MFFQIVFASLLQILIGLALCFAGFRVFVLILPLFGFFAGFLVTAQAIQELFGGGFLATTSSWVFGLVVGAVFAVASFLFYYAAIVILAGTVGFEIGTGFMSGLGVTSGFLLFIVGLILAAILIAAVIFLDLPKLFIIVLSALAGAGMILTGILLALGRVSLAALNWGLVGTFIRDSWFWTLVFLAIAAGGIVVQMFLPEEYSVEPNWPERMSPHAPNVPFPASSASTPAGTEPAL